MKIFKTAVILVMFTLSFASLHAQMAISPPYVFIDGKTGIGNLYLSNNSEQSQEVEISFAFGYPGSDAEGNSVMNYTDTVAFEHYALDQIVRAFPRTFILPANQKRTIRIQAKPSSGMKDGFYFTRLKVLAKPQTPDVAIPVTDGITTKINFNFEQVIPAFYARGKVSTGLKIDSIYAIQKDTLLIIKSQVERMGNAPFIGSMIAKLMDVKGKVVTTDQISTTAYFKVLRRIDLNVARIAPGSYKLEVTFETKRGDMSSGDLVQATPVGQSVDVLIK